MIRFLKVENFGIIRRLELELDPGFNVITGESGAGKSLVARAIAVVTGARVSRDMIHPEADRARVEALFLVDSKEVGEKLEELGLDPADELLVRRVWDREGRGRVFINDSPVTLRVLQGLVAPMVEIQGQRESLKLLDPSYQLEVLDRFSGCGELLDRYSAIYAEFTDSMKRLKDLKNREKERLREVDYLEFVISEIESASLSCEEEAELLKERERLLSWDALERALEAVEGYLETGEVNAQDLVASAISELSRVSGLDEVKRAVDLLSSALENMQEALFSLRGLVEGGDYSPERLNEIEERLELYKRMKMKYGSTVKEVLRFLDEARAKLAELKGEEFELEELEERVEKLRLEAERVAEGLSEARQKGAERLSCGVVETLKELGFESPAFRVEFRESELGPKGKDHVEFLFSANPEVPLMPLRKVASGGELSRVLLALKKVLSKNDETKVMLFDEIDAGVGGRTAVLVARALRDLSRDRQVIAITHFPQIASLADRHLVVEKALKDGKTFVRVRHITGSERETELERMAGGVVKDG